MIIYCYSMQNGGHFEYGYSLYLDIWSDLRGVRTCFLLSAFAVIFYTFISVLSINTQS